MMTTKNTFNVKNFNFQFVLISSILDSSPEGILVVDERNVIAFYNNRFIQIWNLPVHEEKPKSILNMDIGSDDNPLLSTVSKRVKNQAAFQKRIEELYQHPELEDICEIELKDGRTLERHSKALWDEENLYLGRVWFFRDITKYKNIETKLTELVRLDPLTNIANRRYLIERAQQEFIRAKRYASPLCIASIDIDHFKNVNDTYGHAVGDEMLKSISQVILKTLRMTELLGRVGGEEFVILIPDTELAGAQLLGERIRKAVAENSVYVNDQTISCTISIGIARLGPDEKDIAQCFNRADEAMYRAKAMGRNKVVCDL